MKTDLNLNYLVNDLDESEMASVAGGIKAAFLERQAGKINAGTLNMTVITQRLLNDANKGSLYYKDYDTWAAGTTAQNRNAWASVTGALRRYLGQSALPGATADNRNTVSNFLLYLYS